MDSEFTAILKKLIKEQGRETLLNAAKCKVLLADYTHGEYKKESRLLLQALDAGVQKAIDTAENIAICEKQQVRLLQEEHFIVEEMAADIVDTLALVLRGDEPKSNAESLIENTEALIKNKEYDEAINDLNEAIRLDPTYALAYRGRGDCYNEKGQYEDARRDFEKALSLNPKLESVKTKLQQINWELIKEGKIHTNFNFAKVVIA
jgi:tetratricopeptide (TPR) repeat protein